VKLSVGPEPVPATAARGAGGICVETFALIGVIVVDHVPVVDNQSVGALGPDVDRAAGEWLAFPRDQCLAVSAMRAPIVLPGEVVEPLAHETAVRAKVFLRVFALLSGSNREAFALIRREVGLKDQYIRFVIIVVIGIDGLAQHLFTGSIVYMELHQILLAE